MRTALAAMAALLLLAACASQQDNAMESEQRARSICSDYGQEYACTGYDGDAWTAVCIQRDPVKIIRHELE